MSDAVQRSVTVNVPPERAFDVFTAGMSGWWPMASHHIGEQDAVAIVIEPRPGGRWFERGAHGAECDWGFVTEWDPPRRVLLAWHLNADWDFDPDPARASEVEVRFTANGTGTLVELEHRGFGDPRIGAAVAEPGGWADLLETYARAA